MCVVDILWALFLYGFAAYGLVSVFSYVIPSFYLAYLAPRQDLKKKYGARWAVVTGGSSGIGAAISEQLAEQGINICIVALKDRLLEDQSKKLAAKFPNIDVRAVGVDLTGSTYVEEIRQATSDIDVSLVFNNAGYLVVGSFRKLSLEGQVKNLECNMMAALKISHVFYTQMVEKKLKGAICFTSSAAGYFPAPFSAMYGASKSFVSAFAASLALEAKDHGIDVMALHPSFTRTNLYQKTPQLKIFEFLNRFGAEPPEVANIFFTSVGRCVWRDTGAYAFITRLVTKVYDFDALAQGMYTMQKLNPDFENFKHLR